MKKVTERTKVPTLREYTNLRAEDQLLSFQILQVRNRIKEKKVRKLNRQSLLLDAHVHKLRAQRRYLYTAQECAHRLEIATQEREGKI